MRPDHVFGLDLGQASEYTALAIVERSWRPHPDHPDRPVSHYGIRHLRRWPPQTSYTTIAADLAALLRMPPLNYPLMAVDQTGAGRAVVDLLRKSDLRALLRPFLITMGQATGPGDAGVWHVPKRELASCLQVLLQSRRLQVAPLPERELLIQELLAFRLKNAPTADEDFESWRERAHDDLVLAVALAVWSGEKLAGVPQQGAVGPPAGRATLEDRMNGPRGAVRRNLFGLGEKVRC